LAEPLSQRLNIETPTEDAGAPVEQDQSRAVAEYLGDMIGQLEGMARLSGFDLLVYLLSMARVEAEANARMLGNGIHSLSYRR
jgi:hypothetical protein